MPPEHSQFRAHPIYYFLYFYIPQLAFFSLPGIFFSNLRIINFTS
jgi:hypothetical protein